MKHKQKGYIWYLFGTIVIIISVVSAGLNLRDLFLPTTSEILGALTVPSILALVGIGLIILGKVIPEREAYVAMKKARMVADGYTAPAYSYETAYEAIEARIVAWESMEWSKDTGGRKSVILDTLRNINRGISDLGKMSSWFHTSLSGPLYDAAREAVGRVDANKLKFLSGFISYCASVTEYEIMGDYFYQACQNAQKEVTGALDLYAGMRAKLNTYSGDPDDVARLKEEIEQITGLFN